jgi:hypothetical protein
MKKKQYLKDIKELELAQEENRLLVSDINRLKSCHIKLEKIYDEEE